MSNLHPHRLHDAAADGDNVKIKRFIRTGDNVNRMDEEGMTPLAYAVENQHTVAVKLLLAAGADPSLHDQTTPPPLYRAAEAGDVTITKLLINAKADLNVVHSWGTGIMTKSWTPLNVACCDGRDEVVRLLIEAGCDLENNEEHGLPPLFNAANGHISIVDTLIAAGANINATCRDEMTVLHAAVLGGNYAVVKKLVEVGVELNQIDSAGCSPLHHAARKGFNEVVKLLVSSGAEIEIKSNDLVTPLHLASQHGRHHCVYTLLCLGADVLAKDIHGFTALHSAVRDGHLQTMEILLSAGMPASSAGNPPLLFLATIKGQVKAAKLLLEAKADPNLLNAGGNALFEATNFQMIKVLLEGGGSAKMIGIGGGSILHYAGSCGLDAACICALFKAGADPLLVDNKGRTAADCAREKGHHDAAKLLDLLAAKHRAMNTPATARSNNDDEKEGGGAAHFVNK